VSTHGHSTPGGVDSYLKKNEGEENPNWQRELEKKIGHLPVTGQERAFAAVHLSSCFIEQGRGNGREAQEERRKIHASNRK